MTAETDLYFTGYTLENVAARLSGADAEALEGKLESEIGHIVDIDPETGGICAAAGNIMAANRFIEQLILRDAGTRRL